MMLLSSQLLFFEQPRSYDLLQQVADPGRSDPGTADAGAIEELQWVR